MALSIISNQAASIATRNLGQANNAATDTAEKLSTIQHLELHPPSPMKFPG